MACTLLPYVQEPPELPELLSTKELQSLFSTMISNIFLPGHVWSHAVGKRTGQYHILFPGRFRFPLFTCFLKNLWESEGGYQRHHLFCLLHLFRHDDPDSLQSAMRWQLYHGIFAFDIDNCSDTAVIMFKFLTVKSLPFLYHFFHFPHPSIVD